MFDYYETVYYVAKSRNRYTRGKYSCLDIRSSRTSARCRSCRRPAARRCRRRMHLLVLCAGGSGVFLVLLVLLLLPPRVRLGDQPLEFAALVVAFFGLDGLQDGADEQDGLREGGVETSQ